MRSDISQQHRSALRARRANLIGLLDFEDLLLQPELEGLLFLGAHVQPTLLLADLGQQLRRDRWGSAATNGKRGCEADRPVCGRVAE
jgi:hypothetical protein